MPVLQWYPWKLCLIKYESDINELVSYNFLNGEIYWNKNDLCQKNDGIFHILIRLRFRENRWHAFFALRVTWNYAYNPLKRKYFSIFQTVFLCIWWTKFKGDQFKRTSKKQICKKKHLKMQSEKLGLN